MLQQCQAKLWSRKIYSIYTRGVAYQPYLLILMNKGALKSQVLSIPEDVQSCYRNRNMPLGYWNGSVGKASQWLQLYRSTLENFNIPLNVHETIFLYLQTKHASYLTSDTMHWSWNYRFLLLIEIGNSITHHTPCILPVQLMSKL